jgi:hypothetical protein
VHPKLLEVYYWPTPNAGKSASWLEWRLPYAVRPAVVGRGDQFKKCLKVFAE